MHHTYAQIPPGCGLHASASAAMGLGGRHEVRQQQPRALLEDTGLQSRPTTDGSIEIPTTDAHVCANGPASVYMLRMAAPWPAGQVLFFVGAFAVGPAQSRSGIAAPRRAGGACRGQFVYKYVRPALVAFELLPLPLQFSRGSIRSRLPGKLASRSRRR
jgi:hypothetical protein